MKRLLPTILLILVSATPSFSQAITNEMATRMWVSNYIYLIFNHTNIPVQLVDEGNSTLIEEGGSSLLIGE